MNVYIRCVRVCMRECTMAESSELAFGEVVAALQAIQEMRADAQGLLGALPSAKGTVLKYEDGRGNERRESEEEGQPTGRGGRRAQEEVIRQLFERVKGDERQTLYLLRLLLPSEDRERVYGMKTRRLMRVMAAALGKAGRPEVAARLRQWQPKPSNSSLVRNAVVCVPESEIATAATAAILMAETKGSIEAVCRLCDTLTRSFLELQPDRASPSGGADTGQVEALLQVLNGRGPPPALTLDFHGWLLLVRILLKRVSVGVGPATVMAALSGEHQVEGGAAVFYARQRSLEALARAATSGGRAGGQPQQQPPQSSRIAVRCGVPFKPMTGDAIQSPYLLKWLFSREDKLRRPIPPIEGRLVILPNPREGEYEDPLSGGGASQVAAARWFVPPSHTMRMAMVPLEEDRVMQIKRRQRHLLLLRDFKRSNLLNAGKATGLVLHYSLSSEEDGKLIVFLLRDVSDAIASGVELLDDETAVIPATTEAFRTLPRDDFLRSLIRAPSPLSANESEKVYVTASTGRQRGGGGSRYSACLFFRSVVIMVASILMRNDVYARACVRQGGAPDANGGSAPRRRREAAEKEKRQERNKPPQ
jgi:hypothetical protein